MNIEEAKYKKGTYIFIMGDTPDYFYIVKKGQVKINFKSIPSIIYSEGEFFGEFSILTSSKRTGSALALTDVVLNKIDKRDFYDFLRMFPAVLFKVINRYCSYIESIDTYFGGSVLKTESEFYSNEVKRYSFKEALELFFDGKYEDAIDIMKKVIENNDEEKWQAKAYLALSYAKIGKDIKTCKKMLTDVIENAPTPAEKDLAMSIMDRLK